MEEAGSNWQIKGKTNYLISQEAVDMMDNTIINEINSLVNENDILWHLGDFCFGRKDEYYKVAKRYRDRIKCRNVNLIFGNHDRRIIADLFNHVYDQYELYYEDTSIILNHYAMAIWNHSHHGTIHLYGHSHGQAEEMLDKAFPNRKSMDVGVDNIYKRFGKFRPVSLEEILKIFSPIQQ